MREQFRIVEAGLAVLGLHYRRRSGGKHQAYEVEAAGLPHWRAWVAEARAAIDAMREPTLDMLRDGHEASRKLRVSGVSGMTIDAQIRNECAREFACWSAMIDTALAETTGDTAHG